MYLVALRCVISNFCIDCLWWRFHIDAQYSRFGRTRLKYAADFVSWLMILRFLFRNPSMLLAFFDVLSMWWLQDRSWLRSTPKYYAATSWCPFRWQLNNIGFLDLVTRMMLHLSGWKDIPHVFSHSSNAIRSFWSSRMSLWRVDSWQALQTSTTSLFFGWVNILLFSNTTDIVVVHVLIFIYSVSNKFIKLAYHTCDFIPCWLPPLFSRSTSF